MLLAVYSDDNNEPDQRLAVTASTTINSNAGWQTVELTSTVDVNEGDKIWLAWLLEDNPGVHCQQGTPGQVATVNSSQGWAYGMPADFGSGTTSDWVYSICAGFTPDQQDQQPELIGNPYMFTGRRFDLETELYYYRARYYNPYIGRFLQTDPIGYSDGINWYNYCRNNPLNYIDSTGLVRKGMIVTDRYWVYPWVFYDKDDGLSLSFIGGLVNLRAFYNPIDYVLNPGSIADQLERAWNIISTQLHIFDSFLKTKEKFARCPVYVALVEVRDWVDTNDNGKIDRGDTFSRTYWLQIAKKKALGYSNVYLSWAEAADAAGNFIARAWTEGIFRLIESWP